MAVLFSLFSTLTKTFWLYFSPFKCPPPPPPFFFFFPSLIYVLTFSQPWLVSLLSLRRSHLAASGGRAIADACWWGGKKTRIRDFGTRQASPAERRAAAGIVDRRRRRVAAGWKQGRKKKLLSLLLSCVLANSRGFQPNPHHYQQRLLTFPALSTILPSPLTARSRVWAARRLDLDQILRWDG